MENQTYFLDQNLALVLVISISILFVLIGILYSRKHQGLLNYLIAGRNVGTTSLTTSLVASALGAWILFGPASAATWGGIGSVIGYALGSAFPMIVFIFLGTKIRKVFPKGSTLTEFVHKKFGKNLKDKCIVFESNKLYENKIPSWIMKYVTDKGYKIDNNFRDFNSWCWFKFI